MTSPDWSRVCVDILADIGIFADVEFSADIGTPVDVARLE